MLSVILVNYKSIFLIRACVTSIYANTSENIEIIVVDNSDDDLVGKAQFMADYPQVRWISMGYNSGFARANNAGIKAAKGDSVLLLNSDTLNINDTITVCYNRLRADNVLVAAGVQLLNLDKTPQISGNFFMPFGLNYLMALPYVGKLIRKLGLLVGVKITNIPEVKGIAQVDWINGAFLMVKKTAIEKAGLLDEDFFLYAEEAEWCYRLSKFGQLVVYGDLHIIHLEGATSSTAFNSHSRGYQVLHDKKGLQIMLSNLVRFRKQHGVPTYLFHQLMYTAVIPIYLLINILLFKFKKNEWRNWIGYSKNVLQLFKYSKYIFLNKPHFYKVL